MAGVVPTAVAAASQNEVPCAGGRTFMLVRNAAGIATIVTILGQSTIGDVNLPDRSLTIGAGTERLIGPIDPGRYAMANGNAQVNFSATTSVTVNYFQVPA
jgi:hypothetical protein